MMLLWRYKGHVLEEYQINEFINFRQISKSLARVLEEYQINGFSDFL